MFCDHSTLLFHLLSTGVSISLIFSLSFCDHIYSSGLYFTGALFWFCAYVDVNRIQGRGRPSQSTSVKVCKVRHFPACLIERFELSLKTLDRVTRLVLLSQFYFHVLLLQNFVKTSWLAP